MLLRDLVSCLFKNKKTNDKQRVRSVRSRSGSKRVFARRCAEQRHLGHCPCRRRRHHSRPTLRLQVSTESRMQHHERSIVHPRQLVDNLALRLAAKRGDGLKKKKDSKYDYLLQIEQKYVQNFIMHHCNIMYPSCDTIYTGVMLNVEIPRSQSFLVFVCFPSAVSR